MVKQKNGYGEKLRRRRDSFVAFYQTLGTVVKRTARMVCMRTMQVFIEKRASRESLDELFQGVGGVPRNMWTLFFGQYAPQLAANRDNEQLDALFRMVEAAFAKRHEEARIKLPFYRHFLLPLEKE